MRIDPEGPGEMAGIGRVLLRSRRYLLLALLGTVAAASLWGILRRGEGPVAVKPPEVDVVAKRVRYVGKGKGGSWQLELQELQYSLRGGIASGKGVHLSLTGEDGRTVEAWAREGRGKMEEGGFVDLEGDVKVVAEGWTLTAQRLRYDLEGNVVTASGPFRAEREGIELRGEGFTFHVEEGILRVRGGVEVTLEGGW